MKLHSNTICLKSFSVRTMKNLSFILYFSFPFIKLVFSFVLSKVGLSVWATIAALFVTYLPVAVLLLVKPRSVKKDFFILYGIIAYFIFMTYLLHPEYAFWYKRSYYGVWDYVLRPDNGIFAYFFIRLIDDADEIIKNMKRSAIMMYPYYAYLLLSALRRGYWITTDANGATVRFSYDLSYGYNVLIYALVFLFCALKYKKLIDIVMAAAGIAMILLGGSRGPLLCVVIFIGLYILMTINNSKKKIYFFTIFTAIGVSLLLLYKKILHLIITVMDKLDVSSRTITMLLEGDIADDNGRDAIWGAAIEMIRDKPLGYGALGTRHVIYYVHDVGHCHEILLEMLVDFGVIFGTVLILFLIINALRILFAKKYAAWSGVFLIFFSRACQLFLSGTYWHVTSFWACIGIGICACLGSKKKGWKDLKKWLIQGRAM